MFSGSGFTNIRYKHRMPLFERLELKWNKLVARVICPFVCKETVEDGAVIPNHNPYCGKVNIIKVEKIQAVCCDIKISTVYLPINKKYGRPAFETAVMHDMRMHEEWEFDADNASIIHAGYSKTLAESLINHQNTSLVVQSIIKDAYRKQYGRR